MKQKVFLIAPSILSADFSRLEEEVRSVEKAGADLLHVDVMDGHFVPNITIGPLVVSCLRKKTELPLDVHLMIDNPLFFLDSFIKSGSTMITVHIETCTVAVMREIRKKLHDNNVKMGISLNPGTPLSKLKDVLALADLILVMTVNPGFGGQAFMPEVVPKIGQLRKEYSGIIEVDGGITDVSAPIVLEQGADILVAGAYVFHAIDRLKAIESLRKCRK
ncbi:MAG: ribulose-phosphate 3-epimerase [Candidatus Omnitrophica bacterium]|nr:ribulose-phosphate 3-epimerase [Candidatus Omnitrophota bacterium]MBU4478152.1 ribulose-phosphate 3-epimerase [Candidatus Omnitrophota bacterium]MCG2704051.1 ribulose-phosphate 3-epimerase [Candidatus Omnitrophota bacterium]